MELQKAQQIIHLLLATNLARLQIIILWCYTGIRKNTVVMSESFSSREMNVHLLWENTDDWEQMMDWLKSIRFWWNSKYHVTSKLYYSQWLIETPLAHKYLCHVWTRRDLDSYGFKPWNRVGIRLYHGMVISHTVSKPAAMVPFEDSFLNLSKSHMQWCHLEHWQGRFFLIL